MAKSARANSFQVPRDLALRRASALAFSPTRPKPPPKLPQLAIWGQPTSTSSDAITPLFLRAPRVVIPASINALHFYQELGYAFAPGGDRLDEEQLYCLEKFPQRSV